MQIRFGKKFVKQYENAPQKIKIAFDKRLALFRINPFQAQLNNHPLGGKFIGFRSINVTGDWRAIFQTIETAGGPLAFFHLLGTHAELYE